MKPLILATALSSLLITSIANAEGFMGLDAGQFYGGISVGNSSTKCAQAASAKCSTNGHKFFAGYRATDLFGLELGYYNTGQFSDVTVGNSISSHTTTGVGIAATASYTINESIEVFGKLGGISLETEAQATHPTNGESIKHTTEDSSLLLGLGGALRINETVGVRAEYETFDATGERVNLISAGMTFNSL